MSRIIATVVTYNRLHLLKECVSALRSQTRPVDKILVINNGSTISTEEWLKTQTDIEYITQENTGGAGGFCTAIETGYKKGYEWIWCMDDDGAPKEDALEKLLAVGDKDLKLLNCAVINREDKKSFVWKTGGFKTLDEVHENTIEGIGHPFNGTFINRRIVERVGVPKSKLFLWGDETEYYYRIVKRNKIPVCTVTNSIHYHPACTITFKQDWDYKTAWKMYYYVRNRFQIHQSKYNNSLIAFANYCCFLAAMIGVIVLYQKTDKLKKTAFIIWPAVDAFRSNYKATPQTILARLNLKSPILFKSPVNLVLQNIRSVSTGPFSIFRKVKTANA